MQNLVSVFLGGVFRDLGLKEDSKSKWPSWEDTWIFSEGAGCYTSQEYQICSVQLPPLGDNVRRKGVPFLLLLEAATMAPRTERGNKLVRHEHSPSVLLKIILPCHFSLLFPDTLSYSSSQTQTRVSRHRALHDIQACKLGNGSFKQVILLVIVATF